MKQWTRPQDWILLLAGVWTFLTPWMFGFSGEAAAPNAWTLGVIMALVALWALAQPAQMAAPILGLVAGVWLFISPWAIGFTGVEGAAWNAWIVGVLAVALTGWVLSALRREGVEQTA